MLHLVHSIFTSHYFDCLCTLSNHSNYIICMRDCWLGDIFVAEVCRVREPLAACLLDVAQVGSVMF